MSIAETLSFLVDSSSNVLITAATSATSTITGALEVTGGVGIGGVIYTGGGVIPRIVTTTSNATITPTAATADQYTVTALATTATLAAPSGVPVDGQKLVIRIKDNGTARPLTWTTSSGAYRAVGVTLPTTTVLSKVTYVGCIYNSQDTFWDVVALAQQA